MPSPLPHLYQSRIDSYTIELTKLNKQIALLAWIRLLLVVAGFGGSIYFSAPGYVLSFFIAIVCGSGFFYALKKFQLANESKLRIATLIRVNEEEIIRLKGYSHPFDEGKEFENIEHHTNAVSRQQTVQIASCVVQTKIK